jgi:transposase
MSLLSCFGGLRGRTFMTEYQQKQLRKSVYIPLCCKGKITCLQAAQRIGISIRSVSVLKKRYRLEGEKVFKRPSHPGYNKKYSEDFINLIISLYHKHYEGAPEVLCKVHSLSF